MTTIIRKPPIVKDVAAKPVEERGVIIQQTPVNLRTVMYQDFKVFCKKVWKIVLIAIMVVVVYYVSGLWGLISFVAFLPVSYIIIPKIAERFMSYVNTFSLELNRNQPDRVRVVQIPYARAEKALIQDSAGFKASFNAPFLSELGLTYCVDGIILNEPVPGLPPDITIDRIVIHENHKNMDFTNHYGPVFLDVRKENIVLRRENFALRSLQNINIVKEYVKKVELFYQLGDKILFEGTDAKESDKISYDMLQKELDQIKAALGISTQTPFQQLQEIPENEPIEGIEYAGQPGKEAPG